MRDRVLVLVWLVASEVTIARLLCFAGVGSMIWEAVITRLRKRVIDKEHLESQEERLD
jgi:hypothetical protein